MKTGIFKYNRRDSGFELKRLVAMLLVLVQCASLAFVGAPVAYAETEDPQDAVVVTQDGEPSQDPDEEENGAASHRRGTERTRHDLLVRSSGVAGKGPL